MAQPQKAQSALMTFFTKLNTSIEHQLNEMGLKEEDWRKSYETSSESFDILPTLKIVGKRIQKGYSPFATYSLVLSHEDAVIIETQTELIQLLGILRYFLKAGRIHSEYKITQNTTVKIDKELVISFKDQKINLVLNGVEASILIEFIEKMGL